MTVKDLNDGYSETPEFNFGDSQEFSDESVDLSYETKQFNIYSPSFSSRESSVEVDKLEMSIIDMNRSSIAQVEYLNLVDSANISVKFEKMNLEDVMSESSVDLDCNPLFSKSVSPVAMKRTKEMKLLDRLIENGSDRENFNPNISENLKISREGTSALKKPKLEAPNLN